jgi:hypothetical protein
VSGRVAAAIVAARAATESGLNFIGPTVTSVAGDGLVASAAPLKRSIMSDASLLLR